MFKNDNKTVLLTGGTGFIGHHIFQYIMKNTDWNVVIIDRFSYAGSMDRIALTISREDWHRVKIIHHDLRSSLNCDVSLKLSQCKFAYILHLAASTHVDRSISNPIDFVLDNVVGTCNLLDWYRYNSAQSTFLYFSTDEVFGPVPTGQKSSEEWDCYNSNNPYAATKAGAEELCLAFSNTYDLDIRITHTMNVFAEGQHIEKFIPLCVNRILEGKEIQVHANKDCSVSSSRQYIHASKVAEAVLFVLKYGKQREKYNIVGQREITNEDLVLAIGDILLKKPNYRLVDFHSSRPGHDIRYAMNGDKLKDMGFCYNSENFIRDLTNTVNWYMKQWNISAK